MGQDEKKRILEEKSQEVWGCGTINPRACRTCRFSHGKPPFEDMPEKAYCMIFSRDEGEAKPPEVYYEGEDCEFYEKMKG
jgi:hypothetical protein